MMRMRDPNGPWKTHSDDPRLLVARRPDDVEGEFFRVFPEGTIQNWDGVTVSIAPAFEGLDLNRNWPADWAPEGEQLGAGPYPASEPEVQGARRGDRRPAEHHELRRLPHVLGRPPAPVLGTAGRGLPDARPPRVQAHGRGGDAPHRLPGDLDLPRLQVRPEDGHPRRRRGLGLRLPRRLRVGDRVLEPAARSRDLRLPLHRLDPRAPARGRRGAAEARRRGRRGLRRLVPVRAPAARPGRARGLGSRLLLVQPAALAARGGGSPARRLRALPRARLAAARSSVVRLERRSARARYRLRLVLENSGWLPTHVTQKALDRKAVRPIEVELELPEGARIATGKAREEAGPARGPGRAPRGACGGTSTTRRATSRSVEWVVEAPAGAQVGVVARHERAGTARAELVL